jgi:hypothetical protein
MAFNRTGSYNTAIGRPATSRPYVKPFRKIDSVLVDGERWYTVKCNNEVSTWIRSLPHQGTYWYEHITQDWMLDLNKFDINEKVYVQMCLKWS